MSTATQPQTDTNQQPAADFDPQGIILRHVYAPYLFNKLASDYGIQPKNDQEADAIIQMAFAARSDYDAQQVKKAATASPILRAFNKLSAAGAAQNPHAADAYQQAIRHQAGILMSNPGIAKAAMLLTGNQTQASA